EEFEMRPLHGSAAEGKGMALFPRRVDGRYVMLTRQDNENIWLLRSDDLYTWEGGDKLICPRFPWDMCQMGNCGSPIEIDEGWLVITHGVGMVRTYCMGAALLDKADPAKVLARTPEPILRPSAKERDGYVPNVVYSCGGMVHDRTLLLPYGIADNFAAFATCPVDDLLNSMS
ncbi:MAG: glycosidase, partial [Proteobacteria bacterium]|nr:glycosidase [Pseudomonadota bacterium]